MELNMRASLWFMLFLPSVVVADVPNTFQAGEAIKASEMNENFQNLDNERRAITDAIADLEANSTIITTLESELALLKSDIASLETSISSSSGNSSGARVFVGFSEPAVFGGLGLNLGRAMCPNSFPDSQICSPSELQATEYGSALENQPLFLVNGKRLYGSGGENPCVNFSSKSQYETGFGYLDGGKIRVVAYESPPSVESSPFSMNQDIDEVVVNMSDSSSLGTWVKNNTSFSYDSSSGYSNAYDIASGQMGENASATSGSLSGSSVLFSVCNITVPAACCR